MGVNHATSGAAVWFAATAALPSFGTDVYPLAPASVLAGAVVCAGAALLPDADHHSGTISNSVPVLGKVIAGGIGRASGGHRHGFHSVLAGVLVTLLAVLAGRLTAVIPPVGLVPLVAALATVPLIAFAVKARSLVPAWSTAWGVGLIAFLGVTLYSPDNHVWFPIAVGLGFAAHLVGDMLTVDGIPSPTWPIQLRPPRAWSRTPGLKAIWKRNGNIAVPLLGRAGSARELVLGSFLGLYVVYGVVAVVARAVGHPLDPLI